ncbi:TLC domain-containing protein [Scheffersomyces amazonensis]|uniref:TLC domain-containing protein n=1 Tax=Scheffersomyces amazonensis TaxID=1078765 RepID=UPI00315CC36B
MDTVDSNDSFILYQKSYLASIERNQISVSRFILIVLYGLYYFSSSWSQFASKFLILQYPIDKAETNNQPSYDIGWDDCYFVIHGIILLTFLRSSLMYYVFSPIASRYCNIHSRKARVRFAEQGWTFTYATLSCFVGMYLFKKSPYYFNLDYVFLEWPHDKIPGELKAFYLISIAFWLQQIFVLNIEQKRKDYLQMFSHHIITCCLTIGSYYYYFTRIGHIILMIMDSGDTFLSSAKMLKYAGFSNACDVMFLVFLVSWVILRHGVYNYLFYHTWNNSFALMTPNSKCVEGIIQKRCWTENIIRIFLGLLGGLQIILCIWMYFICKVAYKVIRGSPAEDVRSDADDTDVELEDDELNIDDSDLEIVQESKEKDNDNIESTTLVEKESSSDGTLDENHESD